jgi:hypothetical protein
VCRRWALDLLRHGVRDAWVPGGRMGMRVIITGSGGIPAETAERLLEIAMDEVLDTCGHVELVLTCGESNVDEAGVRWAKANGVRSEVHGVRANGRTAPTRNYQLLDRADVLVLLWDGTSGAASLLRRQAEERGLLIAEMVLPAVARGHGTGSARSRERRATA